VKGVLVRVGIDSTCGEWNAPVTEDGEFAYVPIPEGHDCHSKLERFYDEFVPAIARCGCKFPPDSVCNSAHVDPDFDFLTYGDQGQRGRRIRELGPGDLLAFYAGLRSTAGPALQLVYALIGIFIIDEIVDARDVPRNRWRENAHTRRKDPGDDVIVRARPNVSGRLRHCLKIGEYRDGAYRVTRELLSAWGDLCIRDGFIHRSVQLPKFRDAERFYAWFIDQRPELVQTNNPLP
jgi:hypothetical protein